MAGHTPGPWNIIIDGTLSARWPRIAVSDEEWDGGDRVLADLESIESGVGIDGLEWEDVPNRAEVEANARLIAAAPELLAACEAALDRLYASDGDLFQQLRAAIAKARP